MTQTREQKMYIWKCHDETPCITIIYLNTYVEISWVLVAYALFLDTWEAEVGRIMV
jgi:hypothetical protein